MSKLTKEQTWKEKHNVILENKKDIIKKYNENMPIKEIAKTYKLTSICIYKRLERWGIKKKSGIKYLLGKMILETLF